jgi:hypothetical protein
MIMKRSKLNTKIGFISSVVVACTLFLASCDTFETDPDLQVPDVELESGELVVMTNGSTFIDLATQIKSNVPINFSITSPVQNGLLTDLGGGLLQYQPTRGLEKGRDSFVFSVFSENNQFITKDTIVIVIENDSTQLPCGIYTNNDYVYGFSGDSSVVIDVLANDFICSIDSVDVRVSIHRPAKNYPPYFGTASVVDNKIVYTAGASFQTSDKLLYKIESVSDASKVSYGYVYITSENPCWPVATNDFFVIDSLETIADSVFIPAFDNDRLCSPINNSQVSISRQPNFGSVRIATRGFLYTAPETLIVIENFTDSFTYQLCDGNRCTSAQVTIYWPGIPDSTCTIKAVVDSIDLSGNNISPIGLDVLFNDVICDSLKTFKITTFPTNGIATIQGSIITYERDFNKPDDDKLEYTICDELGCSSAKVFIKRE